MPYTTLGYHNLFYVYLRPNVGGHIVRKTLLSQIPPATANKAALGIASHLNSTELLSLLSEAVAVTFSSVHIKNEVCCIGNCGVFFPYL